MDRGVGWDMFSMYPIFGHQWAVQYSERGRAHEPPWTFNTEDEACRWLLTRLCKEYGISPVPDT